jgi:hypothetical protein
MCNLCSSTTNETDGLNTTYAAGTISCRSIREDEFSRLKRDHRAGILTAVFTALPVYGLSISRLVMRARAAADFSTRSDSNMLIVVVRYR